MLTLTGFIIVQGCSIDWLCDLTADRLTCQHKKPKPKHLNEKTLQEWLGDIVPFRAIQIDPSIHRVCETITVAEKLIPFEILVGLYCY